MRIAAYCIGAGGFSYAVGTSMRDSLCAAAIGLIVGVYSVVLGSRIRSRMLTTIIAGVLIALLANVFVMLHLGDQLSLIILGAMMDLVPGVAFVNSVREFSQNNFPRESLC